MKDDLENELKSLYPEMFSQEELSFECGAGWYSILKRCILRIKEQDVLNQCVTEALQIKEKYASLRFYVYSSSDEVDKIIQEAEEESEHTCEICGEPGTVNKEGYWKRLRCESCRKEASK